MIEATSLAQGRRHALMIGDKTLNAVTPGRYIGMSKEKSDDIATEVELDANSVQPPEMLHIDLARSAGFVFVNRDKGTYSVRYLDDESSVKTSVSVLQLVPSKDGIIESKLQSVSDRLNALEQFAIRTNGKGVAEFALQLFPEFSQLSAGDVAKGAPATVLPVEAPEIYEGLRGPEIPPDFVKRVYGPWLGQGLTRADIRKLDPKLSVAITNWLSRPGNEWPADVDLPTKSEQTTRWVERIKQEGVAAAIDGLPADEALKAANRFRSAINRRSK